jgi:hypothetical protein
LLLSPAAALPALLWLGETAGKPFPSSTTCSAPPPASCWLLSAAAPCCPHWCAVSFTDRATLPGAANSADASPSVGTLLLRQGTATGSTVRSMLPS